VVRRATEKETEPGCLETGWGERHCAEKKKSFVAPRVLKKKTRGEAEDLI